MNAVFQRRSREVSPMKKGVLRNFTKFAGKHRYQSLFFNGVAVLRPVTLLKGVSDTGVFSCESSEISKNTFVIEQLRTTVYGFLCFAFSCIWSSNSV